MKKVIKFIAIVLSVFIFIHLIEYGYNFILHIIYPLRYEEHIEKYSSEYDLDKFLVMAVIKAESNYIPDAHSGLAHGLMQLTPDTAKWISDELDIPFSSQDIESPEKNIKFGCFYLSYLKNYYDDDETLILSAYNAGMGNVSKWLKNPEYSSDGVHLEKIPFKETREYVEKVEKYKKTYKELYK